MKFYNPFKWYIWQSPKTGKWYIRRWELIRWVYLDNSLVYSWSSIPDVLVFCRHNTKKQAEEYLTKYYKMHTL